MKTAYFMSLALQQARLAYDMAEVPVGAVITDSSYNIIHAAHNLVEAQSDPTAHAEIICLREAAAKLNNNNLSGCTLYTTLEPCGMCAHAIGLAKVSSLIFGAYDIKTGAIDNGYKIYNQANCHHKPHYIGGILEQECSAILTSFFTKKRQG